MPTDRPTRAEVAEVAAMYGPAAVVERVWTDEAGRRYARVRTRMWKKRHILVFPTLVGDGVEPVALPQKEAPYRPDPTQSPYLRAEGRNLLGKFLGTIVQQLFGRL
jgi:hypothetical protein